MNKRMLQEKGLYKTSKSIRGQETPLDQVLVRGEKGTVVYK